jgi:hypothetical protein
MQNWILDYDFCKSASYLDRNRLQANIYENIHGIASLLNINDKLVNPKKSVKNHPNIKQWEDYIEYYLQYILCHLEEWQRRGYKININRKNMSIIFKKLKMDYCSEYILYNYDFPKWINDDLIKKHQQLLLEKDYEYYSKYFC